MSDDTKVIGCDKAEEDNNTKETKTEAEETLTGEGNKSKDNITSNDTKIKEVTKRPARKAQRTERKQIHPLHKPTDSEEDLLQTIPEDTMAKDKDVQKNASNIEETEEVDLEELVKESPNLVQRLSSFLCGIWTLLKVFGGFVLSIWSKFRSCLPSFLGVAVSLGLCFGLDYLMIPLTYNDLPHYPARLQYISRMAALGLFPIIFSWFTGLSPVLARLVQSALRDLLLMIVVHCALVTFLPVEQMHWISIIMFVSVLFRLVHWFSVCHNLPILQAASEAPLQLCQITITLYTFLSILAQEMGYMQTPTITKPRTADVGTDSPEWVYPTMCNVMQRLFCAASKPDRLYA